MFVNIINDNKKKSPYNLAFCTFYIYISVYTFSFSKVGHAKLRTQTNLHDGPFPVPPTKTPLSQRPFQSTVKMADVLRATGVHWVSEVFRPNFEFETVDDLLDKCEDDAGSAIVKKDLKEVYDRVYYQTKFEKAEAVVKDEVKDEGANIETRARQEKKTVEDDKDCMWSGRELSLLRKFFQKAKLQNIKLTAMLDASQTEMKKWKEKYVTATESLALGKEVLGTLKKKHKRLKICYRALKEDLKSYHSKLKLAREDLKEFRTERTNLLKELNATKTELSMEKFRKEEMQSSIKQRELEFNETIANREFTLREQYLLEMSSLKKDMELLRQEFEKEKQNNVLNKKALDHLRNHFANLQLEDMTSDKVLSVIDIDYFSS